MAEEKKEADGNAAKSGGGIVPWIVVGILSAGAGSAVPMLLPAQETKEEKSQAASPSHELPREEETVYVPFGEPGKDQQVVVNLNEGRMTRYLRVAITLQIPKTQEEEFRKKLDKKKAQLRNWLLSEISDKELDEIRGAAGQNRLRRTIREHFNSVLFPEGFEHIYDVLFEDFNVQ